MGAWMDPKYHAVFQEANRALANRIIKKLEATGAIPSPSKKNKSKK